MLRHRFNSTIAALALAMIPFAAGAGDELPPFTEDGLELVPDSKLAAVYVDPSATLAPYGRIKLLDPYVAFKKNWEREQRRGAGDPLRLTSGDIQRIKDNLAGLFTEVFTEVLTDGGYPVVDEPGEDVLLVRPAIVNLDVTAPDTMRSPRSRSYTNTAGEMTLYVELYDSVTGDLLAKALDRRMDRETDGYYTWTNASTNRVAAKRILKGWAGILLKALDEARQAQPRPSENAQ